MAAGALAGLGDILSASSAASGSTSGHESGEEAWEDGKRARESALAGEIAFAEGTLAMIMGTDSIGCGQVPPLLSLSEALYPPGRTVEATKSPFPSSRELITRLAEAEGPGGSGPKSREALVLRSLLGAELWDSGGRGVRKEALEHLRKASRGLDRQLGDRAPDSLAAKERLARRLGGMFGQAGILPFPPEKPAREVLRSAAKLFRDLWRLAPQGRSGEALRRRAEMAISGLSACCGEQMADDIILGVMKSFEFKVTEPDAETGRRFFDRCEFAFRLGLEDLAIKLNSQALALIRYALGGRCPEAAAPLSRTADFMYLSSNNDRACTFWAFALEALAGEGEWAEPHVAELELRIGRLFVISADCARAIPLLSRAEERLRRLWGEESQQALECAAYLAHLNYWSGNMKEAERRYRRIASLLDGAPPRRDPAPGRPSDEAVLSLALAGIGATMIYRRDRPGGEKFIRRSAELRARLDGGTLVEGLGDFFRSVFLDSSRAVRVIRPDGIDFIEKGRTGLIQITFACLTEEELADAGADADADDDGDGEAEGGEG
jgi:hypothetical protein